MEEINQLLDYQVSSSFDNREDKSSNVALTRRRKSKVMPFVDDLNGPDPSCKSPSSSSKEQTPKTSFQYGPISKEQALRLERSKFKRRSSDNGSIPVAPNQECPMSMSNRMSDNQQNLDVVSTNDTFTQEALRVISPSLVEQEDQAMSSSQDQQHDATNYCQTYHVLSFNQGGSWTKITGISSFLAFTFIIVAFVTLSHPKEAGMSEQRVQEGQSLVSLQ